MSCEIDCPRVFDSTRRATTTVAETLGQEPNRIGRDPVISCTWLVSHQNTFFDQASFHQLAALNVRYGQTVFVKCLRLRRHWPVARVFSLHRQVVAHQQIRSVTLSHFL